MQNTGGTIRDRNDRSRNRRTDEVPFIAGCSHFTRKNTRFRAPASSPTHSPCNIMQPFQCDLQPPFIKVKSQSHTTLQGQVSIRSASTLHQGHVKSHTTLQGELSIAHHPSRSSLNRTPPFKIKSQSRSTLQGQLSIAHHPSRSSLNRTPPFKIKSQSRSTLQGQVSIRSATTLHQGHVKSHTTLQGQLSIAHHPSRSSLNRTPPFLNRAPPFKVKSQSHTTLQGQVSIAHHPSSFQDSEFYLSVPRKYCFPTSFDYLLPTTYYLLPTTYYLLPTTYYHYYYYLLLLLLLITTTYYYYYLFWPAVNIIK